MQSTPGTRRTSSRRSESHLTVPGTVRTPTRASPGAISTRFSQSVRPSTSRLSLRRLDLPSLPSQSGSQQSVQARTTRSNVAAFSGANIEALTVPNNVATSRKRKSVKATVTKPHTTENAGKKRLSVLNEEPILPKRTKPIKTKSVAVQTDRRYAMSKASDWDAYDSFNLELTSTCPVCFNLMHGDSGGDDKISIISVGKCGHCFCQTCSVRIYKENPKCPLCQAKINLKDFRRIYLN